MLQIRTPRAINVWAKTLYSLLEFIRLHYSVIGIIFCLIGFYLSDRQMIAVEFDTVWKACIIVFSVVSMSYAINDYFDFDTDALIKSYRPLASGSVAPTTARLYIALTGFIALGLAFSINLPVFVFTLMAIILSFLYSAKLKAVPLIGNATIAYLNASSLLFPAAILGYVTTACVVASVTIFLYSFIYEILSHLEDIEIDSSIGQSTTATVFGISNTLRIVMVVSIVYGLTIMSPYVFGIAVPLYIVSMPFALLPVAIVVWAASKPPEHIRVVFCRSVMRICLAIALPLLPTLFL
jgi:geranylgeranylglycerol-phosphate geranylgeranyltransferase